MQESQWTEADLFAEPRSCERALRRQGDSSVETTYVDRSETFLRWLAGNYVPCGPNVPEKKTG